MLTIRDEAADFDALALKVAQVFAFGERGKFFPKFYARSNSGIKC